MAGAIAAPSEDNSWRRIVNDGQRQASDIWASVNSAAAAAAKGTWEASSP